MTLEKTSACHPHLLGAAWFNWPLLLILLLAGTVAVMVVVVLGAR